MTKKFGVVFMIVAITLFNFMPTMTVNAGVTDPTDSSQIIRITTTNYYTRVVGNLNITGTDTYSKDYNSGEDYIAGNYTDSNIATIINGYKEDMNTVAETYLTTPTFDEGVTEYYYEAHDEITQPGSCQTDPENCTITINTILDKYQIYTLTGTATTKNIKNVDINLTSPIAGETVTLTEDTSIICVSPNGCWIADKPPIVTTNDNITVDGTSWIMGTYPEYGDGYDNFFEGTFEKDKYYYAMISILAKDGYKLSNDLTIKVNGQTPAEVFAVYNNENTHFIAKIKAVEEEIEYKILDGANQTYTLGSNTDVIIRASGDLDKLQAIEIDNGNVISSSNYKLDSGSTILTLLASFLENSSVGEHTITFRYNDGEVSTKLTIANATNNNPTPTSNNTDNTNTTNNPQTADNILFYISMLGLSIIGLVGAGIYTKKKVLR